LFGGLDRRCCDVIGVAGGCAFLCYNPNSRPQVPTTTAPGLHFLQMDKC
jgi:hypothetical protein